MVSEFDEIVTLYVVCRRLSRSCSYMFNQTLPVPILPAGRREMPRMRLDGNTAEGDKPPHGNDILLLRDLHYWLAQALVRSFSPSLEQIEQNALAQPAWRYAFV